MRLRLIGEVSHECAPKEMLKRRNRVQLLCTNPNKTDENVWCESQAHVGLEEESGCRATNEPFGHTFRDAGGTRVINIIPSFSARRRSRRPTEPRMLQPHSCLKMDLVTSLLSHHS